MADKVQKLGLERDYKQYLYFINKDGNVARKKKAATGRKRLSRRQNWCAKRDTSIS